ncbi:patatin-like phospholipase family protein [[Mycobacterium] nativiensis]|uniref:Patatin-like phospholipase family protein n=1 Tax=[Mycobacterium] nativiensis TaxID=2855503 RepID=A0ABU5Y3B0_9MYCO|nr:patatin-like phospholipase family protein [Mycolicibacter sp. MYC340]MEB3034567.1 patatin-like phospholipase family protein [Mycolicibacter sp. MYC340]
MQIPFVETLLGMVDRRPDPIQLTGPLADDAEVVDVVDTGDTMLLLQKMENRLVRHSLRKPEVLSAEQLRRLRYLLNFARLDDFEPGAAGPGGTRGRGDVSVGAELAPWRAKVADVLHGPLRAERDPAIALIAARDALGVLTAEQDEQRRLLTERHGNDFSQAELDAEVGHKKLVTVLGGGGGAGFVYIGGMQALLEAGPVPDYLIGSSFGSILGSVVGRARPVPIDDYVAWAKTVSFRAILGPERLVRRHGLTGVFSLNFDRFAEAMFRREDGEPMRMSDLAIPFDAVVAGVRRQPFAALPSRYRNQSLAALQLRSIPYLPIGVGPQVATRLWQTAAFIDPRVVTPLIIGGDNPDRDVNVVDAASFSSAIPGVLHHETKDRRMEPLFDAMLADHDVAALVDGGAASNVPVELAWKRVRDGRLGTRNACYLAFDCFQPQWDPKHLWLVPITQAIQLQMVRNAPYADHLVRFSPTLSPVNLAPSAATIDRACEWGRKSVQPAIPVVSALLEPIWWEGEKPALVAPKAAGPEHPHAASMSSVMAASQPPRTRWERWRKRKLA